MTAKPWCRRSLIAGWGIVLAFSAKRTEAATATIVIDDYLFMPAELRVSIGTTVVWENRDSSPHNVLSVADPRVFRSRAMATGERFEFTFAAPGTYGYFCGLHPHMQGFVVVE
ncbi:MAG: hypothetical protein JWR10_3291 [Rubritepida sp.]|nr:hypothetical protein [Rubritepida sp.]